MMKNFTLVSILLLTFYCGHAQPVSSLSDSAMLCNSAGYANLNTNNSTASHIWSTGDTTSYIQTGSLGWYFVTLTDNSGTTIDSCKVIPEAEPEVCIFDSIYGLTVVTKINYRYCSSFLWDFGYGPTSTIINPTHVYPGAATYVRTLYAYGSCGVKEFLTYVTLPDTTGIRNPIISSSITNWTVDFSLMGMPGRNVDSILWEFGDGNTDTTAAPTYTYSSNNNYECYTVNLIFFEACKWDTITKEIAVGNYPSSNPCNVTTSIQNLEHGSEMLIYPNPSDGLFNVQFEMEHGGEAKILVLNLAGEMLFSKKLSTNAGLNQEQLDLKRLGSGMYLVQIQSRENKMVRSVVVY